MSQINSGDIVKIKGLSDRFRVVSKKEVSSRYIFELLSLKNNEIRRIASPPYDILLLKSPVDLIKEGVYESSARFNLFVEANRLKTIYQYDPLVSVTINQIDAVPHQIEAVYKLLDGIDVNHLIADEAGLGKTIIAGMLIEELLLRQRISNILIVVPAALQYQWYRELLDKFGLKFQIFDSYFYHSHYRDSPWENPFDEQSRVVISVDYAKRTDIMQHITSINWDLVIIDEAHKLASHKFGSRVYNTRRYVLGEKIRDCCSNLLFLTATPHSGESYAFFKLISLLNPYLFTSEFDLDKDKLRRIMIRRLKEDAVNFDGTRLFPRREAKTITLNFSDEESYLYDEVRDYVQYYFNLAKDERNRGVSFAMTILQKRMASSIYAITKSLENRLNRLSEILKLGALQKIHSEQEKDIRTLSGWDEEGISIDDLEDSEKEKLEKKFELLTMAQNVDELMQEIDKLKQLILLAKSVEYDSKAQQLLHFIQKTTSLDPTAKILIFTEYTDTLDYLVNELRKIGFNPAIIHGRMKHETRRQQQGLFESETTPVMVATDAAGEGLNLQFAHIMVNYELPWNPNRLEQRIGRLHRYGQKRKVFIYNILVQNTIEGRIFQRLLDKIESIKHEMGDRIFDVLGLLLYDIDLEDIIMEALGKGSYWEKDLIIETEENIDERTKIIKYILEEKSLIRNRLDLTSISKVYDSNKEHRLDEKEIERFVRIFLSEFGGEIGETKIPGVFKIKIPNELKYDWNFLKKTHIIEFKRSNKKTWKRKYKLPPITFSKKIAKNLDKKVKFIALGDPFLETFIAMCIDIDFGGKTTIKYDPKGRKGILFVYKGKLFTSSGKKICDRLFCLFFNEEKNEYEFLPAESIWDFEDVVNPKLIRRIPELKDVYSIIEKADLESTSYFETLTSIIRKKHIKELNVKKKDLTQYIQKIEEEMETIINQYNKKLNWTFSKEEKNNLERLKGRERAKLKRISGQINNNLDDLEKEEVFISDVPEILALAVILPSRRSIGKSQKIDEIEQAGMLATMEYEISYNRNPKDVSKEFRGYDIKSYNEEEERYIEVKSFNTTGILRITSHEWITAKKIGNDYWLYVVENSLNKKKRKLHVIQNPYKVLQEQSKEQQKIEYTIIVKDWKKFASN